ncbi:MAG: ATP-binding cassette domain-containing protein [Nitrospirae bacterium]|nr:ATP-binding cassette domain-containing protein [Nitrospirota bacterium]
MIAFSNVTKHYDNKRVLFNVSFDLKNGELVFLTGPSGAGKTTLLKLIYCFERPGSGKIIVDNMDVSAITQGKIPQLRRKVGIVFQDFRLFTDKTVFDNVAVALQFNGMHPQKIRGYVNELLEKVGMLKAAREFPQHLSGGEQQRIVIARAKKWGCSRPPGNFHSTFQVVNSRES